MKPRDIRIVVTPRTVYDVSVIDNADNKELFRSFGYDAKDEAEKIGCDAAEWFRYR